MSPLPQKKSPSRLTLKLDEGDNCDKTWYEWSPLPNDLCLPGRRETLQILCKLTPIRSLVLDSQIVNSTEHMTSYPRLVRNNDLVRNSKGVARFVIEKPTT